MIAGFSVFSILCVALGGSLLIHLVSITGMMTLLRKNTKGIITGTDFDKAKTNQESIVKMTSGWVCGFAWALFLLDITGWFLQMPGAIIPDIALAVRQTVFFLVAVPLIIQFYTILLLTAYSHAQDFWRLFRRCSHPTGSLFLLASVLGAFLFLIVG